MFHTIHHIAIICSDKDKAIDFYVNKLGFFDPYKLIREDEEHRDELRYDVLGKVGKVLFVVCTFREGDTIRLISARPATKAEKARYEHGEDQDE